MENNIKDRLGGFTKFTLMRSRYKKYKLIGYTQPSRIIEKERKAKRLSLLSKLLSYVVVGLVFAILFIKYKPLNFLYNLGKALGIF